MTHGVLTRPDLTRPDLIPLISSRSIADNSLPCLNYRPRDIERRGKELISS